jgi:hypothetical protein
MKYLVLTVLLGACAQPIDAAPSEAAAQDAPITASPVFDVPDVLVIDARVSGLFPGDHLAAIVEAAEQWNRATAGRLAIRTQISDADDGLSVWIRPTVSTDTYEKNRLGTTTCIGCYPSEMLLNIEQLERRTEEKSLPVGQLTQKTALHELGHVLGIGHLESGLMFSSDREVEACVDAAALAAFCDLYGCPADAHSTCPEP